MRRYLTHQVPHFKAPVKPDVTEERLRNQTEFNTEKTEPTGDDTAVFYQLKLFTRGQEATGTGYRRAVIHKRSLAQKRGFHLGVCHREEQLSWRVSHYTLAGIQDDRLIAFLMTRKIGQANLKREIVQETRIPLQIRNQRHFGKTQ